MRNDHVGFCAWVYHLSITQFVLFLYYLIPYYDLYMLMYSLASCTSDLYPADWETINGASVSYLKSRRRTRIE
jgi:hypothetical protein